MADDVTNGGSNGSTGATGATGPANSHDDPIGSTRAAGSSGSGGDPGAGRSGSGHDAGFQAALDYPTALGASTPTSITLLGRDLAKDVMGEVGFGELAFW